MNCLMCGRPYCHLGTACPWCTGGNTLANHLAAQQNTTGPGANVTTLPGGTGQPAIDAMVRDSYFRGRDFERTHILAKFDAIMNASASGDLASELIALFEELRK